MSELEGEKWSNEGSSKLGNDVGDAERARELSGVSSEHERESDGRVEVRAWNLGAEDQ